MSLEKIYTFFSPPTSTAAPPAPLSDHALNGDIPAARFADGIRQLNSDTFKLTDVRASRPYIEIHTSWGGPEKGGYKECAGTPHVHLTRYPPPHSPSP